MPEPHPDIIVIPVHNRREITLAALRRLATDAVPQWATVLVVDDGSSDGTADAIRTTHPDVEILRGDGTWWWCGAIRRGMEWALARGAKRVFWLNDDCRPPKGGLAALRDFSAQHNAVAWIDALAPGGWSYGGHRKTWWRVRRCTPDEEKAGSIDTFSGNCVCLPRHWIEKVGLPDDRLFPHGIGDLDYGLRLRRAGAELHPVPLIFADSMDPSPESSESWLASQRPMSAIWNDFRSPRSFLHFSTWRRFALRHWGPAWGWAVFAAPYARWCAIAVLRSVAPKRVRRWRRRQSLNSPNVRERSEG